MTLKTRKAIRVGILIATITCLIAVLVMALPVLFSQARLGQLQPLAEDALQPTLAPAGEEPTTPTNEDWMTNDYIGWLELKSHEISTPIVQTTNNDFYMSHDYWGNYSAAGTPFLDYRSNPHADNKLIFGHHMDDWSNIAFSRLAHLHEQSQFDATSDLIWTPRGETGQIYKPVFAARVYETYEPIQRFDDMSDEQLHEWLRSMLNDASAVSPNAQQIIDESDSTITLCCCSELMAHQPWRTIVVFAHTK